MRRFQLSCENHVMRNGESHADPMIYARSASDLANKTSAGREQLIDDRSIDLTLLTLMTTCIYITSELDRI